MSKDWRIVTTYKNETALINGLNKLIKSFAVEAIAENGNFKVGLSGGSMVNYISEAACNMDTSKWKLFMCDERVVPDDDPDSNYGCYMKYKHLETGKSPWVVDQFVNITSSLSAKETAEDYTEKIKEVFGSDGLPRFDALLLGLGPDGHTCSLFPGHGLLDETKAWVAPITDSPKPPPSRVTLTFPILNNARNCVFVAAGKGKADIIEDIIKFDKDLPANLVHPTEGHVYWLLDSEAASKIQ